MEPNIRQSLQLNDEEFGLLCALLETTHARLLVEIRHTDHRAFREYLRHRLTVLEGLMERCSLMPQAWETGRNLHLEPPPLQD